MTWRTEWWKSLLQNRIQKKRMKKNEDSLKDKRDKRKCTHILMIGVPGGEEKERKDLSTEFQTG